MAAPNPEDAPSTRAQPERRIGAGASVMRLGEFYRKIRQAMPKTAGIILIGNEILSGKIQDANAVYLCRELRALGVDVRRISVIPDEVELIAEEVVVFSREFDVVFTSGGVGPTHDDVTIEGVARALAVPVVRHPGAGGRCSSATTRQGHRGRSADGRDPRGGRAGRRRDGALSHRHDCATSTSCRACPRSSGRSSRRCASASATSPSISRTSSCRSAKGRWPTTSTALLRGLPDSCSSAPIPSSRTPSTR